MTAIVKEHDRVVLTADLPAEGMEVGDVGTVVHVYRDGLALEVEFVALDGHTAAVVTVPAGSVRPVARDEIPHARALASA
jgi:predicted component of viral defense system (DUF524 family)